MISLGIAPTVADLKKKSPEEKRKVKLHLSDNILDMLERAVVLADEVKAAPQNYQWKRHKVYGRLVKEFPAYSEYDIDLATVLSFKERKQNA